MEEGTVWMVGKVWIFIGQRDWFIMLDFNRLLNSESELTEC